MKGNTPSASPATIHVDTVPPLGVAYAPLPHHQPPTSPLVTDQPREAALHPVIDPVHIIETRYVGLEVAVIELVQVTGMLTGTPASSLAAISHRLEERIASHRNHGQQRRIIRSQITACRRALQSVGWSLEAQDTRIILTQHKGV